MSTIQNSTVQDLAKAITDQFVNSIPRIVADMNTQKRKGTAGGDGMRGSDQSKFDHDLANRLKRERDITSTIQKQLGLRNQELILLRERNKQVEKEIRSHGTYNNQTSRLFKTMASTMDEVNTKMYNFFKKIDNMSDSAKNTALMFKMVKEDLDAVRNSNGSTSERKQILDPMVGTLNGLLKTLSERIVKSDMSQNDKDAHVLNIDTIFAGLKSDNIVGMEAALDSAEIILDSMTNDLSAIQRGINEHRRAFASIENTNNSIGQHIDFIETLTAKFGDRLGENDHLMGQLNDLNNKRTMLEKETNKILNDSLLSEAEKAAKFANLSDSFKTLDKNLAGLSKTIVEKTKPTFTDVGKQIMESIKTGKDANGGELASGFVGRAMGDFFGSKIPAPLKVFLAGAGILFKAAIDIAEDQRIVQKYGVRMESLLTNFNNAVGTGLKTSEMAEWSFRNRMNNMVLGGQAQGTDQFRRMMAVGGLAGAPFSNVKESTFNYRGAKNKSFSELIGGDSTYQAETYDAAFDMLSRLGIIANTTNIGNAFTKSGGTLDTAYQTGQLPKELLEFTSSLTDNVSTMALLSEDSTESFIDSVNQFQLFGRMMGLNTEATKNLNKAMNDNTRNNAPDLIKRSVMFNNLMTMYGVDSKNARKIAPLAQLQGEAQSNYLRQLSPTVLEAFNKFLVQVAKDRATALNEDGSINTRSANTDTILRMYPQLDGMFSIFDAFVKAYFDKRKKGATLSENNNLEHNELAQQLAQGFFKGKTAFEDNLISKAIFLSRPVTNLFDAAVKEFNWSTSAFGLWVNRVTGWGDKTNANISKQSADFNAKLVDFNRFSNKLITSHMSGTSITAEPGKLFNITKSGEFKEQILIKDHMANIVSAFSNYVTSQMPNKAQIESTAGNPNLPADILEANEQTRILFNSEMQKNAELVIKLLEKMAGGDEKAKKEAKELINQYKNANIINGPTVSTTIVDRPTAANNQ